MCEVKLELFEEVDEYARKLVELYYLSLNDDDIEREYKKNLFRKKGKRKNMVD
jgi:hypothetical protein